jgi:fluoride exporter
MKQLLLIGFGGFIGSIARFLVSKLNMSWHLLSIPLGTLTVNIAGSLVIGLLAGLATKTELLSTDFRLFLMVGVCGGFTTFSSFTNENMMLIQNGQVLTALIYISASVILGLAAVFLGYSLSNLI